MIVKASFEFSPPSVLTWVARFQGTRKRSNLSAYAMAPLSQRMELVSAVPRCGEWIRWKHRFRTATYKCGSNISGNWSLTRKSSAERKCIRHSKVHGTLLRRPRRGYGDG